MYCLSAQSWMLPVGSSVSKFCRISRAVGHYRSSRSLYSFSFLSCLHGQSTTPRRYRLNGIPSENIQSLFPILLLYPPYPPYPELLAMPFPTFPPSIPLPYMPLLPLFLRSYTSMAIAPTPALAVSAKKLKSEKPMLWSVTFMTGRPTMPGRTAPSIQPTLNVRTRGS